MCPTLAHTNIQHQYPSPSSVGHLLLFLVCYDFVPSFQPPCFLNECIIIENVCSFLTEGAINLLCFLIFVLFQGCQILSLTGSFVRPHSGELMGGLSASLLDTDGQIVGGRLVGPLIAAGPVEVEFIHML